MAEATDRPQSSEQSPSDAVMTGEQYGSLPPITTETYQPLSLLAMAGFGLAAIYAVIVLIGAAVALFGRIPWLMAYWTFLIPIIALVICWAARARIRSSEGTVSGLAFTTWGSRLAILVGITYAAYYLATFLVVRYQAIKSTDVFFEQLKQGHLEQAFLLSKGVSTKDMNPTLLRDTVESRFNAPRGRQGAVGEYTRFRQDLFVRFIEMDGEKANIYPRGVSEWEYVSPDGYRVVLNYHVVTSLMEFDARMETFGRDPKPGEGKGRQWQIKLANGVVPVPQESKQMTKQGGEFMLRTLMAQEFVSAWLGKVNQGDWKDAYLDTLKPSERERVRKDKAAKLDAGAELAKLIRLDDKTFWTGKQQRKEIKQRVRNTFQLSKNGRPTFNVSIQPQAVPLVHQSDDTMKAIFDLGFYYLDEAAGGMQYMAEGRLVVSADSSVAGDSAKVWRVEEIDMDTGRSPPTPTTQRTPPVPPAAQEGGPVPR